MSISAFFSALSLVPQLINLVDQAVVSVEQSLQGLSGSQKLAAALAKIDGWLKAVGQDVSAVAGIQPVLEGLVAASVAAFNAAKVFQHADKAPAA